MEPTIPIKSHDAQLISCIAVIEFDIDLGQVMRHQHPKTPLLHAQDEKAICHMSFPDSNAFTSAEGSMEYIFRMKAMTPSLVTATNEDRFVFGFTSFQQRKDKDNTRGYKQQSVVILSKHPLLTFISTLASIIAKSTIVDEHEGYGISTIIQDSFEEISTWKLIAGMKNTVSFRGCLLELEIPSYLKIFNEVPALKSEGDQTKKETQSLQSQAVIRAVQPATSSSVIQHVLSISDCAHEGQFQEVNVFKVLKKQKVHLLWKLWEVILTNQPLMIIADSPCLTSQLVFAAISLISPLQYVGDYRPYFQIYDSEYNSMKDKCDRSAIRNTVIGVTNPFFLKTLDKFPVILRFDSAFDVQMNNNSSSSSNGNSAKKDNDEKVNPFIVNSKKMKININYDRNCERMLLAADTAECNAINNSLVRKAFRQLTAQFLGVFDDYFGSMKNEIKIFDKKEFIKYLDKYKFPFVDLFDKKKRVISLFEKFMLSDNFLTYIKQKDNIYFAKAPLRD